MSRRLFFVGIVLAVTSGLALFSQDFVYTPVNPAFGGNPYNYSWLLSSAESQKDFKEVAAESDLFNSDPLTEFQESLNRQVLSEITRQLYMTQFGESGLQEGFYEFGSYQIDISPSSEGMQIKIIDVASGSETTVIVPYY